MKKLSNTRLADADAERVRQEHAAAIGELQNLPASALRVVRDVVLADGVETPVSHGLGRPPAWSSVSCPRNPSSSGRIEEVRSGGHDRAKVVVLKASGWGATITVDLAVM
jgi:hypothetical protein